ncbi:hypothetical protein [Spirosoma rhododendri]|uniref:Uncharacterized protein n=1 Tax=Spirosoma rhododendri TaxID=2728024 RepID=A0A7L5DSE5_9BACT|nr:hypothetical protein [Spirosoma rhododendri]QJD78877.1 hypothetical protein HH216_10875 [Spirosoma rhododendri]
MLSFKQFTFPPIGQLNNNPFDPSLSTKRRWFYTKKNELNFGVTLPGLCETTDYSTQMLAFFGILLLEIIPTVYGIAQGLLWEAVAAAILIDIALAIASHLWHNKILVAKNQLVITSNPIQIQNIQGEISKYKIWTNFFYALIFLSGCIKFAFFYVAYIYVDAISGAVLVCYLLGAVLHITYTGYFIYTSRYYWFVNSEYNQYLKTGGGRFAINIVNKQPILVDGAQVALNTAQIGLHRISVDSKGTYFFETLGIMTDKELVGFINAQQSQIAQSVIAKEGLKHQLQSLGILPNGVNMQNNPGPQFNVAAINPPTINGVSANQNIITGNTQN